ncbi:MAG: SLATT domain-containing protein [Actinomycetota bacterium]|nr:SLATT domain-containing protein [Actinomycetota bacterium]
MTEPEPGAQPAGSADLLEKWLLQCRRANVAHLRATDGLTWRNYGLGVLTAVLSTVVGSSVYAALQSDTASGVQFAVASLSVIAAALAAIQNILRYGTRAEKHRRATRDYGNAMRWIAEVAAATPPASDLKQTIDRIRKRLDEIDLEAPNVPADIWVWAVHAVDVERKHPGTDASTVDRYHWPASLWHR